VRAAAAGGERNERNERNASATTPRGGHRGDAASAEFLASYLQQSVSRTYLSPHALEDAAQQQQQQERGG
jgi:hypothetical protein